MQQVIYLRRAAIRRDQQVLQHQLERVFQHQWSRTTVVSVLAREVYHPPTDVYETETAIIINIELPGMRDATIELTVDEYGLHVRGARREQRPAAPTYYHQMGVNYGPFELEIFVGQPFNPDAASATYDDGFLLIELPKRDA